MDVSMEDVEGEDTRPTQVDQMTQFVNERVYELVTLKNSDDNDMIQYQEVMVAEYMEQCIDYDTNNLIEAEVRAALRHSILLMYKVKFEVAVAVARETAADAKKEFGEKKPSPEKMKPAQIKRLQVAFTQTAYIGNAGIQFKNYLERCWNMYCTSRALFKSPYVTVVQSSGFGKSRMLYELARMAASSRNMKVLYVCARTQESTGFPLATTELRKWLFPLDCTKESIAIRLRRIFQYAVDNWETVQQEWLELFKSIDADIVVKNKFEDNTRSKTNTVEEKSSTEKKRSPKKASGDKETSSRMVIVVIDEARSLLVERRYSKNNFRLLRRALRSAYSEQDGGVFGVLVDTNSKIANFTPPLSSDPSSRRETGSHLSLFPPFVLTHTMDLFWQKHCDERGEAMRDNDKMAAGMQDDQKSDSEETKRDNEIEALDINAYKDVVIGSEEDAWETLVRMGRPMWYSSFRISKNETDVIRLAANKLLLGYPSSISSYMEKNMFGIASLLCRVGLRPYSASTFAPRAVADFMAILSYVNYEKEGYVSSYASDPILTLGAMKLWYDVEDALANFILPQLKTLIMNEVLDTGGIGEVVARIVLLLAMDKCVRKDPSKMYTGHFITVHAFLEVLGANELRVYTAQMREAAEGTKNAFRIWLEKWNGWQMGFTHFVQLTLEPTEETLWYLLGRRAAGIFPRNQKGADLLIPIFWKGTKIAFESEMETEDAVDTRVSLILIQVKNRSPHDSEFPKAATTKLCPSFVFGEKIKKLKVPAVNPTNEISAENLNEGAGESLSIVTPVEDPPTTKVDENLLSKKSVSDVICMYMNVQEEDSEHHRFIYAKELDDKRNDGSGAQLADTSRKSRKRVMTDAASGGGRTRADVSESKSYGSEPKVGESELDSVAMAGSSNDSKPTAPSELMFTFCYRSVSCRTYKFLDAEVAKKLASLVEPLWDPLVLVGGDLKYRREVEQKLRTGTAKAELSKAMDDEELKFIARKGLADPPGRKARRPS